MKRMKIPVLLLLCLAFFSTTLAGDAAGLYELRRESVVSASLPRMNSDTYALQANVGEVIAGASSSSEYTIGSGYPLELPPMYYIRLPIVIR